METFGSCETLLAGGQSAKDCVDDFFASSRAATTRRGGFLANPPSDDTITLCTKHGILNLAAFGEQWTGKKTGR